MKQILSIFFTFLMISQLQGNNISWSSPPTVLSSATLHASSPQVAIDGTGNIIAVWIENGALKSSTKLVSGNWGTELTVSLFDATSPALVSDSNGNATVVWLQSGTPTAASKTLHGSWSSSTSLSSSGATSPTLCVDSAGDVIAAWERAGNIETATKLFGMNWGNHSTITSSSAASPIVAVGGSGSNTHALIVWEGVSNGTNFIYSSTKLISGSWTAAQAISEPAHNAALPYAAVDGHGNAAAIWYAYDVQGLSKVNVTVKTASRPSSTGVWSAASSLSQPGIRNPLNLVARLAFDQTGNAVALWNISFDDETFNIQSAVKPINSAWSDPVDLIIPNLYAYSPSLATTSFGDILSLYMFYNGNSFLIQSVESDMNGFLNNFWSVPITISTGSDNAFPQLAISLSGNVIHAGAVWVNFNGTNKVVVGLSGSKALVLPPSNLAVTQSTHNFGVFTDYYNTLSWTASTDPNAAGYVIFRNGLFIAQVGADITQFVDQNRAQSGSVTYSVATIDNQQTQSALITHTFL